MSKDSDKIKQKIDEDYQALLEQINIGCDYAKEAH